MFAPNYHIKKEDYYQAPTKHVKEEDNHELNSTAIDEPMQRRQFPRLH